jgi:hypothetical protein
VLGEAAIRSRWALEHHAGFRHRGDHAGIVGLFSKPLVEAITAGAPAPRRDREIVEAKSRV